MADSEYKAILVKNEATNATVFLDVFSEWDPICWMAIQKKSIEPRKKYFHRDKDSFKYKIRILDKKDPENKKTETIYPVTEWKEDKLISVIRKSDGFDCNVEDLSEYPEERQICIRRKNMEDETSFEDGRNLYAILKLVMKEVRKHPLEEQDKIIIKAYRKQMLIFHPDRNPDSADSHICQEIVMAYSILGDHEKRAKYHDLTDYSGGWLSKSRWKAIFKPEAHGSNERKKRIGLLAFNSVMFAGGIAISIFTGGLALPALISIKLLASSFLVGGAIAGARKVISYDTIQNGVDVKKCAKNFAIGGASAVIFAAAGLGLGVGLGVGLDALINEVADVAGDVAFDAAIRWAARGVVGIITDGGAGGAAGITAGVAADVAAPGFAFAAGYATHSADGGADCRPAGGADRSAILCPNKEDFPTKCNKAEDYPDTSTMCDDKVIGYICKEPYFSRMIVKYSVNSNQKEIIVEGSGSQVIVPANATRITVKFENMRFFKTWCDVKKYNRFTKCWIKPTVPHVFTFSTPVSCTFTLQGNLFYVAVMKVTGNYSELDIMD